jgi:DNA repair exonuclease SbcCD ATPase subunit
MTDKRQNESVTTGWLTPLEAAQLIGVNKRYVYRLIERGELTTDGKLHGQRISRDSAEQARLARIAQSAIGHEIDGHLSQSESDPPSKSIQALSRDAGGQIAQSALLSLRQERDQLQAKYDELQEAWRADIFRLEEARRLEAVQSALELGQFKERVKNLEAQLQAAQTVPQPGPAPMPPEPNQITPIAVEPPQPAQEPQKKSFWQRLLGG